MPSGNKYPQFLPAVGEDGPIVEAVNGAAGARPLAVIGEEEHPAVDAVEVSDTQMIHAKEHTRFPTKGG